MTGFQVITQNAKALIVKPEGLNSYEVWIRVERSTGRNRGELIVPRDEDVGVWAWAVYSLWKADWIYQEITSGRRGFRPMLEDSGEPIHNPQISVISKTFSRTFHATGAGGTLTRRKTKVQQRARK